MNKYKRTKSRSSKKKKRVGHKERKVKQLRRIGLLAAVLFVVSILPYALHLAIHPNVWNGILFVVLAIGGLLAVVWID